MKVTIIFNKSQELIRIKVVNHRYLEVGGERHGGMSDLVGQELLQRLTKVNG